MTFDLIKHIKINTLLITKNLYTSLYSMIYLVRYALSFSSIDGSYFNDKRNSAAGHSGHETHRATEDRAYGLAHSG